MSQHYLRSAAYRDLTLGAIYAMSDNEVHQMYVLARWDSLTHQGCPACGAWDVHYWRARRKQWRCKACRTDFTVTSRTAFANHKKSLKHILAALFHYVTSPKGLAGLQLSRSGDYSPKAAHVTLGKLREALLRTQDETPLKGIVEIDGGYFGGKPRKPNHRGRRNDRMIAARLTGRPMPGRKPWHAAGMTQQNWDKRRNKRVVMVLRQQGPHRRGATRTITAVALSENEADVRELVDRYVDPDAIIWTDENPAYTPLGMTHDHEPVNHGRMFVRSDGVNENQAESFFTRQRRHELGVAHRMTPTYLADKANEMAWREDSRRIPLSMLLKDILRRAMTSGFSWWWRGYYQGHHRGSEILLNRWRDLRR
ncbi:IS1595 family transposase [Pseudoxanthomonas sp. X-1]|uniref:IS1595 family transposase n=1 Tax=Pseudoxanthomonas sp. X-1 TaxID=2571115 RepID=UPI00110A1D7F|nr:IS1595 family transposase [Pseudoxanthomonas sp. X-1]TMN16128.1 IS1595 family transposase [Pseudoxanthomonas sp. X-1]UAY73592.1 IS1595 family transposase [Pseudoxanthomonas sp. X-1]